MSFHSQTPTLTPSPWCYLLLSKDHFRCLTEVDSCSIGPLWLAYFTGHNVLKVLVCYSIWPNVPISRDGEYCISTPFTHSCVYGQLSDYYLWPVTSVSTVSFGVPAFLFETSLWVREKIPSPRCNGQCSTLILYKYGLKVGLYDLCLDIGWKEKGQGVWCVQCELLARKHFLCGNGFGSYKWEEKAKELELNHCTLRCSLDVQVRRVSSGHMKLSLREFLGVNTGNCVTKRHLYTLGRPGPGLQI